jgi:hypothetical protein
MNTDVNYPGIEAVVRELSNGAWAISSMVVLAVILRYIWHRRKADKAWFAGPGSQLAGAFAVLVSGHWMRSFSQWLQFIQINKTANYAIDTWWGGWKMFAVATGTIIVGKVLCIFALAPYQYRWHLTGFIVAVSIAIPLAVRFLA